MPELLAEPLITALINQITPAILGTIPAQLERQVNVRVASTGSVTNPPGQLTITGALISAGTYELTCPEGYTWLAAVGSGVASAAPRTVNCNATNPGGRILRTYVFNENNALQSVEHNVVGVLVPV